MTHVKICRSGFLISYLIRLGLKFLPISLDEGIYTYLTNNKISPTYLMPDIPGRDRVASEPSGFGGLV
jgi:hypothetical protein